MSQFQNLCNPCNLCNRRQQYPILGTGAAQEKTIYIYFFAEPKHSGFPHKVGNRPAKLFIKPPCKIFYYFIGLDKNTCYNAQKMRLDNDVFTGEVIYYSLFTAVLNPIFPFLRTTQNVFLPVNSSSVF